MFFLFLCGNRTAGGEKRGIMVKFLTYEDRLEIQNGIQEDVELMMDHANSYRRKKLNKVC